MSKSDGRTVSPTDPAFKDFFGRYPRHEKKQEALNVWNRLSERDRGDALEALPKHLSCWHARKIEKRFIPLPASWLKGRRWEDEIEDPEIKISATANVPISPSENEDAVWLYETYRRSDLNNHRDDPMWTRYTEEAADLPPKTAPTFNEWVKKHRKTS